jgi:hypothetical protein
LTRTQFISVFFAESGTRSGTAGCIFDGRPLRAARHEDSCD